MYIIKLCDAPHEKHLRMTREARINKVLFYSILYTHFSRILPTWQPALSHHKRTRLVFYSVLITYPPNAYGSAPTYINGLHGWLVIKDNEL